MALSYYSNWESIHFFDPPEFSPELLDCLNSLFPVETSPIDGFTPSDHLNYAFAPELVPPIELESDFGYYPKRAKLFDEQCYCLDNSNGFLLDPPLPEFLPEFALPLPLPEFGSFLPNYGNGKSVETVKKPLSQQSIAARQRRRKITEKTQELSKLIPGGQRLNTAEMFEAASKYIKYLQGQIAIFEQMEPVEEIEGLFSNKQVILLQELIESPLIQEKLSCAEKCLVPKSVLETLASENEVIKENGLVLKQINELIKQTN